MACALQLASALALSPLSSLHAVAPGVGRAAIQPPLCVVIMILPRDEEDFACNTPIVQSASYGLMPLGLSSIA